MSNLAIAPLSGAGFLWDPEKLDREYGSNCSTSSVDHMALATMDPEFRSMMKAITTARKERLADFNANASQLELDFTPRRVRWRKLSESVEDTRLWPEWLLIKLHNVLLDDTVAYLHLAYVSPTSVTTRGVMDRLIWVRDESIEAFTFNACTGMSGIDADEVRPFILRKFREFEKGVLS